MAKKIIRQYSSRDDVMLSKAEMFHAQYELDKADFQGYNIVMFPAGFGVSFLAEITDARAAEVDALVIDSQVAETDEVNSQLYLCKEYFQKMKPVIESVFPNNFAVWNQFGFNDYEKASLSQTKMIVFMKTLFKTATKFSVQLIAGGFTAPQIAMIDTLADGLINEVTDQEVATKERVVKTQTRIILYNIVWATMQKINRASKAIYYGNYAKLNQYELPKNSNAGVEPIVGDVPDGAVVNILDMEFTEETRLKLKNTGAKELIFCLSPDEISQLEGLHIPASNELTVLAPLIGSIINHFLNVYSNDMGIGSFEVKLILE